MAITNDERRQVAARLREVRAYEPQCVIATAIGLRCVDFGECFNCHEQTFKRLADLIEPEPERTCRIIWNETDETWECDSCGGAVGFKEVCYCESCGAKVIE